MTKRGGRAIIPWVVAGVLVLAGVVTIAVGLLTPASFGWLAYQPLAAATFAPVGESVVLSRATVIGSFVLTIGLLALAFLAGWRFAKLQVR